MCMACVAAACAAITTGGALLKQYSSHNKFFKIKRKEKFDSPLKGVLSKNLKETALA